VRRAALVAVVVLTGCGSTAGQSWAPPQTVRLGWRERPCGGIRFEVERLVVQASRWRVEATVVNGDDELTIDRPHHQGGTVFGIARGDRRTADALHAALLADRFEPPLPRRLLPSERWHGTFSGAGRLPDGTPLRLVFGRFRHLGPDPRGFLCVSEHHVQL
jgi:hypothetical protein